MSASATQGGHNNSNQIAITRGRTDYFYEIFNRPWILVWLLLTYSFQ